MTLYYRKHEGSSGNAIAQNPFPKKKILPFALLPPELRIKVYELTLTPFDRMHTRYKVATLTEVCLESYGSRDSRYRAMDHPAMTLLAAAVNLETPHIRCAVSDPSRERPSRQRMLPKHAKRFDQNVEFWLEARGAMALRALHCRGALVA